MSNHPQQPSPEIQITVSIQDGVAVVGGLCNPMEIPQAVTLRQAIKKSAANDEVGRIVVDLSQTESIDTVILGTLCEGLSNWYKKEFALRNPNERVKKVLAVTGLDKTFEIEEIKESES